MQQTRLSLVQSPWAEVGCFAEATQGTLGTLASLG